MATGLGAQTPFRVARRSSQQNSRAALIRCRGQTRCRERTVSGDEDKDRFEVEVASELSEAGDAAANVTALL